MTDKTNSPKVRTKSNNKEHSDDEKRDRRSKEEDVDAEVDKSNNHRTSKSKNHVARAAAKKPIDHLHSSRSSLYNKDDDKTEMNENVMRSDKYRNRLKTENSDKIEKRRKSHHSRKKENESGSSTKSSIHYQNMKAEDRSGLTNYANDEFEDDEDEVMSTEKVDSNLISLHSVANGDSSIQFKQKSDLDSSTFCIDFRCASTQSTFGLLKRHINLLELIELDGTSMDVAEFAPIKDYQFYVQHFGRRNRTQMMTQTGDEDFEREIQTDEVDCDLKWTQHPPMDLLGVGGGFDTNNSYYDASEQFEFRQSDIFDSKAVVEFISAAGQLICHLLSLNQANSGQGFCFLNKSEHTFSRDYTSLSLRTLTTDSTVTSLAICPDRPEIILTAFYVSQSIVEHISTKGLLAQWSLFDTNVPTKLLSCQDKANCCCYGPDGDSTVFAGLNDGSVVCWDIREPDSRHLRRTIQWDDSMELPVRSPSYDTAFLSGISTHNAAESGGNSPIVTMKTIGRYSGYQLVCLEQSGTVNIWTVLDTQSSETGNMAEFDLGLCPGGKLKLIKAAQIKLSTTFMGISKNSFISAYGMVQSPRDPSQFYIGTDSGFILSINRSQAFPSGPKSYNCDLGGHWLLCLSDALSEIRNDVICLAISPFESTILLAGCSDEQIRLYKTSESIPILTFSPCNNSTRMNRGLSITNLEWSLSDPFHFYSILGWTEMIEWNLKEHGLEPMCAVILGESSHILTTLIWSSIGKNMDFANETYLAIGYANGCTDIHRLTRNQLHGGKYSLKTDGYKLLRVIDQLT